MPPDPPNLPRVVVVVVAYGPEPWLERSVRAALASSGVDVEVALVDNGGTEGMVDRLEALDGVTVVRPGANVGFATGCNLGAAASSAPFVALVNPDAIVEPDALALLVDVASQRDVGIATAAVVEGDDAALLNSAGNDVHFLGVSWSGHFHEPTADFKEERTVTAASGAGLVCRREVWDALGGFADEFFAYFEDADLSLRAWQRGWRVVFVPAAVISHRYEFSRNPLKFHLLERNRLTVVLTVFGPRQLLLTFPALLVFELSMVAYAAMDGWLRQKLSGYLWLIRRRAWLRARRARVQGQRVLSERALAALFTDRLQPGNLPPPRALLPIDRVLAAYWHLVRRLL